MTHGSFFVIDGNDGSGKHTQAELLVQFIRSRKQRVNLMSFPRYEETFFGQLLRECVDGKRGDFSKLDPCLASLPYANDRFVSKGRINKLLTDGVSIVCDRWVSANQIHQGGKFADPIERRNFLTWLNTLEYGIFQLPRPNISIYLDVPVEISWALLQAKKPDAVESDREYIENSHTCAQWLVEEEGKKDWITIQCVQDGVMRSREDIHKEIVKSLVSRGDLRE